MRLIFVRHGEPDYGNDCLTANGVEQAKCTAERLRGENIKAIYSSPMGRAVETASFTADIYGLDVKILDFMHEIDWGGSDIESNGHPWTLAWRFLAENKGYISGDEWSGHRYFKDNICMRYYSMISEKFDGFLESFGIVRRDGLYVQNGVQDDTIALFAHGGSGAVMFSHLLGLPFPFVLTSLVYGVCSVSAVEFVPEDGGIIIPRLSLFNDMGHLSSVRAERLHFEK